MGIESGRFSQELGIPGRSGTSICMLKFSFLSIQARVILNPTNIYSKESLKNCAPHYPVFLSWVRKTLPSRPGKWSHRRGWWDFQETQGLGLCTEGVLWSDTFLPHWRKKTEPYFRYLHSLDLRLPLVAWAPLSALHGSLQHRLVLQVEASEPNSLASNASTDLSSNDIILNEWFNSSLSQVHYV